MTPAAWTPGPGSRQPERAAASDQQVAWRDLATGRLPGWQQPRPLWVPGHEAPTSLPRVLVLPSMPSLVIRKCPHGGGTGAGVRGRHHGDTNKACGLRLAQQPVPSSKVCPADTSDSGERARRAPGGRSGQATGRCQERPAFRPRSWGERRSSRRGGELGAAGTPGPPPTQPGFPTLPLSVCQIMDQMLSWV